MSADGVTPNGPAGGATRRAAVKAAVAERRARVGGWVHERTGHRGAFDWLKGRTVPGGARWAYVTGPVCLGLFAVVFATGLALMPRYVPSVAGAWASVHHLESTPGGSTLRGLHFWATHALIVAFAVHLGRLMLAAAFRSPRELAWVSGVLLMPLLVVAAVTGNPLSGSEKAFEQIGVEAAILGSAPVAGPALKRMLVGGPEAGNLTLTHLYALHVAFLPLAVAAVGAFHLYQLLLWGTVRPGDRTAEGDPDTISLPSPEVHADRTPTAADPPDAPYVPDQLIRNAVAFAAVFGLVYALAARRPAPLEAPPGGEGGAMPRPEWYFRSLFELRNYVPPAWEFLATGVAPAALLGVLAAVPWIDRLGARVGAAARYAIVFGGLAVWGGLTITSISRDRADTHFGEVRRAAAGRADRAKELAETGVPPEGPALLLARDPRTRGPELFRAHCATCHAHTGPAVAEWGPDHQIAAADCGGANLAGFGSRRWTREMLNPEKVDSPAYFGCTPFAGGEMTDYVRNTVWGETEPGSPEAAELERKIEAVAAALAAEAGERVYGGPPVAVSHGGETLAPDIRENLDALVAEGRDLMTGAADGLGGACTDCHNFAGEEYGYSVVLDGYGSRAWLADFIANAGHERFYGEENAMPVYAPVAGDDPANDLTREEILLLTDWLRGDWVGR